MTSNLKALFNKIFEKTLDEKNQQTRVIIATPALSLFSISLAIFLIFSSGIPPQDIILGFHEPNIRKYTGFAVA